MHRHQRPWPPPQRRKMPRIGPAPDPAIPLDSLDATRERMRRDILMADSGLPRQSRLGAPAQLVALVGVEHINRKIFNSNREASFWPSQETLAGILGPAPDNVGAALRKLEAHGMIRCIKRGGREQGPSRFVFVWRWFEQTERRLASTARLDLWPDKRLPRVSQSDETSGLTSKVNPMKSSDVGGRKHRIEGDENIGQHFLSKDTDLHATERALAPGKESSRSEAAGERTTTDKTRKHSVRRTSAPRRAAFKNWQPSSDTAAWAATHCADVGDPCGSHHVEKYKNWSIAHENIPHDADAGFRKWLLDEQERSGARPRPGSKRTLLDAGLDLVRNASHGN